MFTTVLASTHLGNFIIATAAFLVLFLLIRLFAWKNITGIFDQRAQKIAHELDQTEKALQSAEIFANQRETELKGVKAEADKIIEGATLVGADNKKAIIKAAHQEAAEIKERARLDADKAREDAIESVQKDVAQMAVDLAEKILKEELTPERKVALIDQYLDRLGDK
ncbi:F0F1 ATP synthase subunit B [Streptococcus caprae]|uniref:ATP synthase subunit b n=1 Tax=Streptococcus caprae TaxID=1640501 RepID=A0ABV8CTE5_9STRE